MRVNRRLVPNLKVCLPFNHVKSLTKLWVGVRRPLLENPSFRSSAKRKYTSGSLTVPILSSTIVVYPYRNVLTRFDRYTESQPIAVPQLLTSCVEFGGRSISGYWGTSSKLSRCALKRPKKLWFPAGR